MARKFRLGVALLVTDQRRRLLLGQRNKQPNYKKWVIPGGGVQDGEHWYDAGVRELQEETGLKVSLVSFTPYVLEVITDEEHRVILCTTAEYMGTAPPIAQDDLLDAQFFAQNELVRVDLSPVVIPVLQFYHWL
jgi:ADP-ribose pyrophosphatase YjhB (NUDIX family)